MRILAPSPMLQFFNSLGKPLALGKLYTYESGTNTPLATYQSKDGSAHTNPITLSATGSAVVWLEKGKAYRFVVKTSTDVTVSTTDNISADETDNIVVTDYGADPTGVASSQDAFEDAVTAADGGDIYIPKGTYDLSSDVVGNWVVSAGCVFPNSRPVQDERGFWEDQTGGANIHRFRDRVLVGDSCDYDGQKVGASGSRSWVGLSAGGNLTYLDTRSTNATASPIGGVAVVGASRSSDNDRLAERAAIGVVGYAKNDNTNASDKKSAWAFYGHAAQHEANHFTTGFEVDVCSVQDVVDCNPYSAGVAGTTAGGWIGVGGETATDLIDNGDPTTLKNVSCALGIVRVGDSGGTAAPDMKFAKGIVFAANAITGSTGAPGDRACAIDLAVGHEVRWSYSSGVNAISGTIRSDGNSAANQIRQVFDSTGLGFKGVDADLTTENMAFRINPVASAANYLTVSPAIAGGPPRIASQGSDSNIDIHLDTKGTGVVRFGTWASSGDVAVNGYITIKDGSGNSRKIATVA